jgi:hypothetical protein
MCSGAKQSEVNLSVVHEDSREVPHNEVITMKKVETSRSRSKERKSRSQRKRKAHHRNLVAVDLNPINSNAMYGQCFMTQKEHIAHNLDMGKRKPRSKSGGSKRHSV